MNGQVLGAEAIEKIKELTKEAIRGPGVRFAESPRLRKVFVVSSSGVTTDYNYPRPQHRIEFSDVSSFYAWASERPDEGVIAIEAGDHRWLLNWHPETDRGIDLSVSDQVECRMESSVEWLWLLDNNGKMLEQKALILALRTVLRSVTPSGFLAAIRNVKFSTNREGVSDVQHGRESLGQAITSTYRGTDLLPEEIVFDVPRWHGMPFCLPVVCVLELCAASGRIGLHVVSDPNRDNRCMDEINRLQSLAGDGTVQYLATISSTAE